MLNQVNPTPGNAAPGNLNQGNQELRSEMDALKAQMTEVVRVLSSLRGGNDYQAIQWPPMGGLPLGFTPPNPEINQGAGPSPVIEVRQPASVGSNEASAEPRVQTPNPVVVSPGIPQNFIPQPAVHPQSQSPILGNSVYCQPPHAASAMVQAYNPFQNMVGYSQGYSTEQQQTRDKFQLLEERLKLIEGFGSKARDARDLCLIPDVVIPPKFKVPDFDKYRGVTCPKSHLTMYCRKMAAFSHDDKLLIHYF